MLTLLQELPADEVAKAASRLAAGSAGRELGRLGTKVGVIALRAEAKHPGVGAGFASALGSDGAKLSLMLTRDQAVQIGRHVDDIAALPASQQEQLLLMITSNANRFAAFVGRFVENNPGKILFTTATTSIILSNSEAVFGSREPVFGPDGRLILDNGGDPYRGHRGLFPRAADGVTSLLLTPLAWLGGGCVFLLLLFGLSKVWKHNAKDRLDVGAARIASLNHSTVGAATAETERKSL